MAGVSMKRYVPIIATLLVSIFFIVSFSGNQEQGIYYGNDLYMDALERDLTSNGIKHYRSENGFIVYNSKDKASAEKITRVYENILHKYLTKYVFKSRNRADLLINKLSKQGIKFKVKEDQSGIVVMWMPANEEQAKEIQKIVILSGYK